MSRNLRKKNVTIWASRKARAPKTSPYGHLAKLVPQKQTNNGSVLQEKTTTTTTTTTTKDNEEESHRSVQQETKEIRTIRYYNNYKQPTTDQTRRGGNVTYANMTSKLSTVNTDIRQRHLVLLTNKTVNAVYLCYTCTKPFSMRFDTVIRCFDITVNS